jgi:hypothetical protein
MKTRVITYLAGIVCADFEEWATASNIPWFEEMASDPDWVGYGVMKEDVMSCTVSSSYLWHLQGAFEKHEEFTYITLYPEI